MASGGGRPLKELAEAFHNLALTVRPNSPPMSIQAFLGACSKITAMITVAFVDASEASDSLVEEFVAKIDQICNNVSNNAKTVAEVIDEDKANNRVRMADSNCRLLLRLMRGLEVMKVMFQELLKGREVSLQTAGENAYKSVLARYHDVLMQTIAVIAISSLPTRSQILEELNETEDDSIMEMKRYVDGSSVVIEYVDKLFTSKDVPTDW